MCINVFSPAHFGVCSDSRLLGWCGLLKPVVSHEVGCVQWFRVSRWYWAEHIWWDENSCYNHAPSSTVCSGPAAEVHCHGLFWYLDIGDNHRQIVRPLMMMCVVRGRWWIAGKTAAPTCCPAAHMWGGKCCSFCLRLPPWGRLLRNARIRLWVVLVMPKCVDQHCDSKGRSCPNPFCTSVKILWASKCRFIWLDDMFHNLAWNQCEWNWSVFFRIFLYSGVTRAWL